ncbi:biotin transporter BioY [Piscibacillus salipiscarius]|uniref:Biotin transporter n=1 Tax=Piscibacillus salipiscarius TaxID=299480 RepID=A0ABW5QAF3_9BACI|nr:BioY family transporter [Piscibacillus salipiscarius]
MNYQSKNLKIFINCVVFAVITAVLAQVEVPLPLVPISGQTLAVGLTATILGSSQGALAMICYATLGAIGLPVFAGFNAGAEVLTGPTGGYIIGFIVAAFLMGYILERTSFRLTMAMVANTVGMVVILLFGMIQLKYVTGLGWGEALDAGVYPFIVVGLIKAFLASWIGIAVRKRLVQSRLINPSEKAAA